MAFEAAAFPSWVRWFGAGTEDILLARDSGGTIAGALLLDGPGRGHRLCVDARPGTALVIRASQLLSQAGTRACR